MPLASLIARLLPRPAGLSAGRDASMHPAPRHPDPRHPDRQHIRARQSRRLDRQFALLASRLPALRGALGLLRGRSGVVLRLPLGLALVAGGLLAILPVFGLWMIPAGLLLLSVDLAPLRAPVSASVIRLRRRWTLWRRRIGPKPPTL